MVEFLDVSDVSPRIAYVATAGQTIFVVPFVFHDEDHLEVYSNDVLLTLTTDYTVTGVDVEAGGTVTLVTGATVSDSIVIVRVVPYELTTHIAASGPLDIPAINIQFALLLMMLQQLSSENRRTFSQPASDAEDFDILPIAADRANQYLAFGADGQPIMVSSVSTAIGATAFALTLLDDTTAAEARATLGISGVTSVMDFGATGDGTTNDTAAIQDALDAIQADGDGALYFPSGDYKAVGLTWSGAGRLSIYGDGPSTFLQIANTTGTLFTATAGYIDIDRLTVYHPTQNASTNGFFFKFSNATATIRNVHSFNGYDFARWENGCSAGGGNNILGRGMKNDFIQIDVSPTYVGSQGGNIFFDQLNVQADSSNIGTGIRLVSCDGFILSNSLIAGFFYDILAQPLSSRSYLANLFFNNVFADGAGGPASQGAGWWFDGADQTLCRVFMSNCWAGAIAGGGVGAKANDVLTLSWVGGSVIANAATGILIDAGCRDVLLSDLVVTGNSAGSPGSAHGITIFTGADRINVMNCRSGPTYNGTDGTTQTNSQGYGIAVANSGTTIYQIIGNDVRGNITAGILDSGGAGGSRIVKDNRGYNPVGLSAAATMGASPTTITAGSSPETHYVRQSATNTATIAKGGQQVATLVGATTYYTIELGPGESYVTTWLTTAPTYTKDVH